MGKESLKIADGTISLRSAEGVGSSVQVEDTALARKKRDVALFETEELESADKSAIRARCSFEKEGECGSLHDHSLCSEVGGEVIGERRDSWGRTGDLQAMETVWI